MPYLRLQNIRSGEKIEFEQAEVRVGRAPGLEMTLAGEASEVVSGSHARLSFQGGAWVLEDGGSTNGTFIGENRIEQAALEDRSEFRVGTHQLLFVKPDRE